MARHCSEPLRITIFDFGIGRSFVAIFLVPSSSLLSVVGTNRFRVHCVRKQKRDRESLAKLRDVATSRNLSAKTSFTAAMMNGGGRFASYSVHLHQKWERIWRGRRDGDKPTTPIAFSIMAGDLGGQAVVNFARRLTIGTTMRIHNAIRVLT
jgi:hypothetical protein